MQSASIGASGEPPILLYSDPERLLEHLGDALGLDAVMGMAEVAAWAEAPARAIGRFDVRKPPKSLDEMWACASNETERQAIRTAMFGSVMDVVDRFLPDRDKHAQIRSMLSFPGRQLHLSGPLSRRKCAVSRLRVGFSRRRHDVQGARRHRRHVRSPPTAVRGARWRAPPPRQGLQDRRVRAAGSRASRLNDGEVVTAPVVVSNLDPTATFTQLLDRDELPEAFARRVEAIDHRAAYFQIHFALSGLPEFTGPYEVLNEGGLRRNVTFFGTAEQMQARLRGLRPRPRARVAVVQPSDPDARRAGSRSRREARGEQLRLLLPDRGHPRGADTAARRDGGAHRRPRSASMAPNFPDLIERQFNYPAYTYELMFGCTGGDFTHGLLQPEFMGPFRPGPRGWPDNPIPIDGLYLCGAGCHGGPGVTFIPGYNCGYAVLDAAERSRT